MLEEMRRPGVGEGDYVEFLSAGETARGEYHCSGCGYGVTVQATLPTCPMCAGTTWEPPAWQAFAPSPPLQ